ncbi:hypothetical protein NLI92_005820 [Priestia megaterium]|uniref:hypothetical protein n=1 Tax=Priestia megaterium TaxID=1404 RepID=UPI0021ABD082|nr:hypothetical protein [Priestia megaterium]MCR8924531.1 hypothetical protein [Priestia megaterium]
MNDLIEERKQSFIGIVQQLSQDPGVIKETILLLQKLYDTGIPETLSDLNVAGGNK